MTPRQLFSMISSGKFKPAYYFHGTEDYRIVEAEKYIAKQFLPDLQLPVNYRRLDGRKTRRDDLLSELAALPMLGERQVVAISDFQHFKPKDIDLVAKLLDPPDPSRIVVFSSPSQRKPRRDSAFLKKVTGFAEVVEFNRLRKSESVNTISKLLAGAGLSIEPNALDLLAQLADGSRGALETEVRKLISYKDKDGTVTEEDIHRVASGHQTYSVFELAEDVVKRDKARVLNSLHRFLSEGSSPTGVLMFLGQHFVRLYLVKHGKPIEPRFKWLVPRLRQQADGFTSERLESILLDIARTDSALRHSPASPILELERLVLSMMQSPAEVR